MFVVEWRGDSYSAQFIVVWRTVALACRWGVVIVCFTPAW